MSNPVVCPSDLLKRAVLKNARILTMVANRAPWSLILFEEKILRSLIGRYMRALRDQHLMLGIHIQKEYYVK